MKAALAILPGRPLVNLVNGEEKSLDTVLPLVKEFDVPVVGLLMDDTMKTIKLVSEAFGVNFTMGPAMCRSECLIVLH